MTKAGGGRSALLPLPPDIVTLHAVRKGAAATVLREKAANWLQQADGKKWFAEPWVDYEGARQLRKSSSLRRWTRRSGFNRGLLS